MQIKHTPSTQVLHVMWKPKYVLIIPGSELNGVVSKEKG